LPTFRITVAYDGTDYVGWQRQAAGTSIQAVIEDALREFDTEVTVTGAGRTDAGVHALGQVVGFTLPRSIASDALMRALNVRLPADVRVLAVEEAPPLFHARFGARSKTYRYRIWNGDVLPPFERRYAWHVLERLDVHAMAAAARLLEGEHDFAAFQGAGGTTHSTQRIVSASHVGRGPGMIEAHGSGGNDCVHYDITGNGFLRYMVRNIAGSLVEIGRGHRDPGWLLDVLNSRDRTRAGPTAPPEGLFLVRVEYGDL
jgi:tRNA pseudouridine38-40 synthase